MTQRNRFRHLLLQLLLYALGATWIVLCAAVFDFWLFLMTPGSSQGVLNRLDIEPGMNARAVAQRLHESGVITDPGKFYALCRIRRVGHKLQAGEYAFLPHSTPVQVLERILSGKVVLRRFTLPEGFTVRDAAELLEQQGLASREEVLRLSSDKAYIASLGLPTTSLEGYLFPETYYVQKNQDEASILKMMVHEFLQRLPEEASERAETLGLTLHEVVILASIVEKEAKADHERPRIAAVFFNRLRQKMPLQSDPTAVYDLPGFEGLVTAAHLKRSSPYNTYQIRGLPPGPICNPGLPSLSAVLYPEEVPYLYFVSHNDGTHQFSETLAEHQRAVSRYYERRKTLEPSSAPEPFRSDPSTHGIGLLERVDRPFPSTVNP